MKHHLDPSGRWLPFQVVNLPEVRVGGDDGPFGRAVYVYPAEVSVGPIRGRAIARMYAHPYSTFRNPRVTEHIHEAHTLDLYGWKLLRYFGEPPEVPEIVVAAVRALDALLRLAWSDTRARRRRERAKARAIVDHVANVSSFPISKRKALAAMGNETGDAAMARLATAIGKMTREGET